MRKSLFKLLVTGGAGFIGSEFTRQSVKQGYKTTVIDKLTYAGDIERLKEINGKYEFYKADVCSKKTIMGIFSKEKPDIVVNFAAQTHVDNSIRDVSPFVETNVKGTQVLLDAAMRFKVLKFIHISTDEVYGEIKIGKFNEESPLKPSSPYAASKAAADMLIKSYVRTYNFPAIIIRPCNNYGYWQYPEKFIPLVISKIFQKQTIPVYADGMNVREWLYVEDCVKGIWKILEHGRIGEIYNLGGGEEIENIELVNRILNIFGASKNLIKFVKDRPGHDFRYRIDSRKIFDETGWRPCVRFKDGINLTVQWSHAYKHWLLNKMV